VELELEIEQMLKNFPRDLSDGALSDIGEERIEKLAEECRTNSCSTVYHPFRLREYALG
jgi:hypothetical protein